MVKSKFKCIHNCATCGKEVIKNKSQTLKCKTGKAFCSIKCVGEFNGKVRTNKIKKLCKTCGKEYKVIPSLAKKSVACSTECQRIWQSNYLVGENANNYKGRDTTNICNRCGKTYKTRKDLVESGYTKFCSQKCKQEHWKENILHNEEFHKSWFEGNLKSRNELSKRETKPESMVREWLEKHSIKFKQEQGFFHRYFADFYIPEYKMIIEVMGDYWHGNPEKYKRHELNNEQIKRKEIDEIKKKDFVKYGFSYFEIWESDIYHNLDNEMLKIFPATTTRKTP